MEFKDEKHKNNIELKKAITTYLGRQWIAWYNDNIPINDGPFIFKNLPGLIVELYDVENNYNWTLSQYKYDVNNQNKEILAKRIKKAIKLSNKEFNNIINQDFMDPTISIESAGIQVSEDKKTKIREFLKNQKYRFIIKDLMLYL
ncbi:GLPGLI family protein [Empedobacter falsenii]|uniref:GLPGLI family protein n=1 Tax=Empedobacter falsenii TaxID=343874 RepID=UPI003A80F6A3